MPERRRLGAALLGAALLLSGAAVPAPAPLDKARHALANGDGIAAEAELRRALEAGVPRPVLAASMGEALLLQGDPERARDWLGDGMFAPGDEGHGWRMLGRVEQAQGDLPAAGRAYDRALHYTPADGLLWVDIGRLRYAGGEQLQAIAAADQALAVAPAEPRALEFRGQLVRDQFGLIPALPWFERGLAVSPDDLGLLGEYAATLGELDRAHAMLVVTRHMLSLDPGNPRALFLEAVLAARAGRITLARDLLNRADDKGGQGAAPQLLRGVLELAAGNSNLAIDGLDRLVRQQPANAGATMALARAAYLAGDSAQLRNLVAGARNPPPYLLTLARPAGHHERGATGSSSAPLVIDEAEDIRVLAADWAEHPGVIGPGLRYVRKLLASGDLAQADTVAMRMVAANSGSGDAHAVAGDVRLLRGDAAGAVEHYRIAAQVRADAGLIARLARALDGAGRSAEADAVVEARLAASPTDQGLNRLAAERAASRRDWGRTAALAGYLAQRNPRSPGPLRLLATARLALGDRSGADAATRALNTLQHS